MAKYLVIPTLAEQAGLGILCSDGVGGFYRVATVWQDFLVW